MRHLSVTESSRIVVGKRVIISNIRYERAALPWRQVWTLVAMIMMIGVIGLHGNVRSKHVPINIVYRRIVVIVPMRCNFVAIPTTHPIWNVWNNSTGRILQRVFIIMVMEAIEKKKQLERKKYTKDEGDTLALFLWQFLQFSQRRMIKEKRNHIIRLGWRSCGVTIDVVGHLTIHTWMISWDESSHDRSISPHKLGVRACHCSMHIVWLSLAHCLYICRHINVFNVHWLWSICFIRTCQ